MILFRKLPKGPNSCSLTLTGLLLLSFLLLSLPLSSLLWCFICLRSSFDISSLEKMSLLRNSSVVDLNVVDIVDVVVEEVLGITGAVDGQVAEQKRVCLVLNENVFFISPDYYD